MRIALFSPLPPAKTGIAFHSANLLPELAQLAQVTVFSQNVADIELGFNQSLAIRDIESFRGPLKEGIDICLYQMGNSIDFHEGIYRTMRRCPGIVILHDLNIHSFLSELYYRRGDAAAYVREMAYAYGREGATHARLALLGLVGHEVFRYPMFERLVDLNLGTVVHSRFAQERITSHRQGTAVIHINQPVPVPSKLPSISSAKARLGLDSEDMLLASFGYVTSAKRVEVSLRAFAELREHFPRLRYALVGALGKGYNIDPLLAELNLIDAVDLVGFADEITYRSYMAATDIGLNLRYPTFGETSAALLELMAAGKPVLISDVDAFAELPGSACIKVGVGQSELAEVVALLTALIKDQALRQQIGLNAAKYIRQDYDPGLIARQYIDFLEAVLSDADSSSSRDQN